MLCTSSSTAFHLSDSFKNRSTVYVHLTQTLNLASNHHDIDNNISGVPIGSTVSYISGSLLPHKGEVPDCKPSFIGLLDSLNRRRQIGQLETCIEPT